tara:strand:+ start:177 stop:542 length:366 start_codon:yes stop_codon:yes gene_type:complete
MRITKRQLRRIIKEEKSKILAEQRVRRIVRRRLMEQPGGTSAEFDAESVMLNGQTLDQEELASQVSSPSQWMDNFDLMGMYAAQALRDNHGVIAITDYEQPGKSWSVDEFIALKKSIASDF